ncbi:phage tail tape measure protein [Maridesulfovibrio sp.]|uniref:phage tail tape measure protein n=1 Tax=Maridesulfovibrio sp. TaxID=2795000 RepID=UPI0039EEE535
MDVFDVFATFSLLDNITGPLGNIRQGFTQTELAGGRLSESFGALTKSMLPFVLAAGLFLASFGPAIGVAANFEASVSSLGAISKASAADMQVMEQAALDLGASTAFSAAQVVQGQTELAKKGFNANQVVAAMPGLLDLAAATQSDLALASTVASGALKSFNMEASRTGEVADIIAAAATSSATDINGLEAAVSNAGAVVSAAGGDFAELAAITGKLADVNISGAVAGTAIKTMYNRLQGPTGDAAKALTGLGVATKDANGNMLPIFDILGDLEGALAGMGSADKASFLKRIFGEEAVGSVTSILNQGVDSAKAYADALRDSGGAAAEMAAKQLDNMNGALTILGSAWEGLQITIGSIFLPVLTPVIRGISSVVSWLNELAGNPVGKFIISFAAALAATVIAVGLFSAVMWAATVAAGALNLALLANPIVLIGAAVVATAVLIASYWEELWRPVRAFLDEVEYAYHRFMGMWEMDGIRAAFSNLWSSMSEGFKNVLGAVVSVAIAIGTIFLGPIALIGAAVAGLVGAIVVYWDDISSFFSSMWDGICSAASTAFDVLADLFLNFTPLGLMIQGVQGIIDYFSTVDLSECGRKLWTTFTDGLKSMVSAPVETFKSGLQKLRNMLPFSDAKEGPLSTLTLSGKRLMETIAGGVGTGAGALADAVSTALDAPGKLINAGIGALSVPMEMAEVAVDALSVPVDLVNRGLDEDPFFGKAPEPAMVGATPVEVSPITSKPAAQTSTRSSRSVSKSGGITVNGGLTIHIAQVSNLEGLLSEIQNVVERYDG